MGRDPLFEFLSDEMPKQKKELKLCRDCKWFYYDSIVKDEVCGFKPSIFYSKRLNMYHPACNLYHPYATEQKNKKHRSKRKLMLP